MNASILARGNTWWNTGKSPINTVYKLVREELGIIMDNINARRIQLIIGPRRVGKSTLIQQAIGRLLKGGVEARRILFFSCDDPTIFDGHTTIGDIIDCYESEVLHESFSPQSELVYIFIDEIHTCKDWQLWIKNYYEQRHSIKFIVSGSSASHLFEGAKESLMGRTDTLRLMPLSFWQFCRFWATYKETGEVSEFLDNVPKGSLFIEPLGYYEELQKYAWKWDSYKPYVHAALQEFLLFGGYPEHFADGSNAALWQKRLVEDIVGQGLYRDIVSIYRIKNPDRLEKLLYFIADNNGHDFNMKTIADTLGCDNETVSAYLMYLSQAYMAMVLSNYSPNIGSTIRKNKVLYVLDNGIANAMLRLPQLDETATGRIVESVCARNTLAVCENHLWSLHYWRDKGVEVDLVLDRKNDVLPIEVKYRKDVRQSGLAAFRRKYAEIKIPVSVVITKDILKSNEGVLYVPFWLVR